MKKIRIDLGRNSYFVYPGYPLEKIGMRLARGKFGKKVMLLSDTNVFSRYGNTVARSVAGAGKEVIKSIIAPGEEAKNFGKVYELLERCAENRMSRNDTILTLGGGVISDLGGFAASIYMRGINYVSVPTTLLAQVDAAIGGKTGVNLPVGKNLIGSFYQPSFVYMDFNVLSTLPERETRQGLAEIIKYGVIKDRNIFRILKDSADADVRNLYPLLIEKSVMIKKWVVEKDEREEKGLREILNFGHTLGHAVEIAHFPEITHGESVGLGMVGEAYLSWRLGLCGKNVYADIRNTVMKYGLPSSFTGMDTGRVADFLSYDKKVREGKLRFVLVRNIGTVRSGAVIEKKTVEKLLKEMARNERP